jgi:hypothetical protein
MEAGREWGYGFSIVTIFVWCVCQWRYSFLYLHNSLLCTNKVDSLEQTRKSYEFHIYFIAEISSTANTPPRQPSPPPT